MCPKYLVILIKLHMFEMGESYFRMLQSCLLPFLQWNLCFLPLYAFTYSDALAARHHTVLQCLCLWNMCLRGVLHDSCSPSKILFPLLFIVTSNYSFVGQPIIWCIHTALPLHHKQYQRHA